MKEYQRNRERKPARKFSGDFGADRQRGRDSRYSPESFERFGGRPERRFNRGSGRPNRRQSEMYEVVCDKCGKDCEVPFKPTNSKPVYCSDCFKKNDNFSVKRSFEQKSESNQFAEDLAKIHQKLDKIMQALKIE